MNNPMRQPKQPSFELELWLMQQELAIVSKRVDDMIAIVKQNIANNEVYK